MRNGLTPSFPFQVDNAESDYELILDVQDLVKQNLTNLLLTSPGERIMDPEFGVGIRRFLFENRTSTLTTTIKNIINSQVKKYMPFVGIKDVLFATLEENSNFLSISIYYTIVSSGRMDFIQLKFDLTNSAMF